MTDDAGTPLDLLAIAAHPDDAELGCGGTLARLARLGARVGILDLTRGELGSRGNPELRERESSEAGRILGLATRVNAWLPDGGLDPFDDGQRLVVISKLRALRPRIVLLPWTEARHPDHAHAARLGEEACFRAGLFRIEDGRNPFRPSLVLYYMERVPFEPTLVLDVSEDHPRKLEAIAAYGSQFSRVEGDTGPSTYLTRPEFLEGVVARDRHFGDLAGFRYGEPLRARGPLPLGDLRALALARPT